MGGSDYAKYAKAAGDILGAGFRILAGLAILSVLSIVVIVGLVIKLWFPSEKAAVAPVVEPPATVSAPQPVYEIQYPNVTGLCFRTPMGDIGKVMSQDKDILEMTFRGGVKSTYRFGQVVLSDCGVLPKS